MYEIRDPIHKTIEFSEKEKIVIDSPCVQRLRFVRQLGMTFMVYPSAGHDRFTHAVGAMHVAGAVWKSVMATSGATLKHYFNSKELDYFYEILRFAALLHDVGHPAFSHVSEKFMPKIGELSLPYRWFGVLDKKRQATHEDYSVLLIAELSEGKEAVFTPDEAQDIASLVHHDILPSKSWEKKYGKKEGRAGIHSFLKSLISGELDVDRMDYLLRDAHHTGVTYGYYDIEHITRNLGVTLDKNKSLVLTLDSTAVRAFEDFLLARYHMFLQVYLHKTTLCFDYYLEQAIDGGEFKIDIKGDAGNYLHFRDGFLIESLFKAADNIKHKWSRFLITRKPARLVLSASHKSGKDLIRRLRADFKRNGINYFIVEAKQYLSKLNKENGANKSNFLVRRKLFGNFFYEPIEKYSSLLQRYNEMIDLTNLYVMPEDWPKAKKITEKIKVVRPSAL